MGPSDSEAPIAAMAFTGPTEITAAEGYLLCCALERLAPADVYISGAAFGVETVCALAAMELYPDAQHRVYVPAAPHNRGALALLRARGAVILLAPSGGSEAASYIARDDWMLADCTALTGFPYTPVEELRSGSWATIRRARKAGRDVRLLPLREGACSRVS
jgi:hypothetical protein